LVIYLVAKDKITMATSVKEPTKGMGGQPVALRLLLACGAIGPLLFIVVFLLEGATRTNFSPLRQPISSLSIGDLGWTQRTNFIIFGLLLLAFALGLRRALQLSRGTVWGPVLIGFVGIGLIGSGIFIADPFNGYPPGTPLVPTVRTVHGILHDLFGIPVFMGLPIACFVFSRLFARLGERGWAAYSVLTGFAVLMAFVLTSMGLNQIAGLADFAGLFQRLLIILGFTWITLLAVHMLRAPVRDFKKRGDEKPTSVVPSPREV
jgi:hypothetical protein